ncbi:MAG: nucleotidyltransferase domain-containing protein [Prosthecobacter sp.]|jgi:predicted nucleotidyltransferase|uniref:nucleotidyltransferase domain-containing protein n=1 Tax=Prosthecobacter sp. TaxID=1965333 RepID=UPI0019E1C475|nr:nucleotidyltransferase domain-containing protein [Prosthecobacter sp.]MBE2287432.1 nucleotidyltransferase domain-containing protein [Prosthecobacter sp.]
MVTATDSSATAATLREKAQPVIAEATRRLVAEFQPEQIWLFGSYAWGEPTADSDLDLFVIVPDSLENSLSRAQKAHRALSELQMPKDVIVRTTAEVERVKNLRPTLAYKVLHEGRQLYGR